VSRHSDRREHLGARATAAEAAREEESLRARWEATQESLRERFDEPIARATQLTRRTLAWFPIRVWRHFLQHNGFLLAAGVSYQALFAIFAGVYVAFAMAGLWLGGSPEAIAAMITVVNTYIPGLIQDKGGLFTPEQVTEVATQNSNVLLVTGIIALGAAMWTAIGWVTFSRRAVRDIFGLEPDRRNYFLLKARDLLAALVFGVALIVGSGLSTISTWTLDWLFSLFGWGGGSEFFNSGVRIASILVSFVINASALAAMFRFLTGTSLRWRRVWPGALLAGGALTVMQLGAGFLFSYTPTNPLLATFAIFVGLLLWFRINGIIMLVGAAWIAVAAKDRDIPIIRQTDEQRLTEEHAALLLAAEVRLRTAREARAAAPWYRAWAAGRDVRAAQSELAEVEASAPPPPRRSSLLD
jgi:membrane protein